MGCLGTKREVFLVALSGAVALFKLALPFLNERLEAVGLCKNLPRVSFRQTACGRHLRREWKLLQAQSLLVTFVPPNNMITTIFKTSLVEQSLVDFAVFFSVLLLLLRVL